MQSRQTFLHLSVHFLWRAARTTILAVLVWSCFSLSAAQGLPSGSVPVDLNNLHQVSNDRLLKAALDVARPPYELFLSELRGQRQAKDALDLANKNLPDIPTIDETEIPVDEDALAAAAERLKAATEQLEETNTVSDRIGALETLAEQYLERLHSTETSISVLRKSFEDIVPFTLEIELRTEDKTMSYDQIPEFLNRLNIVNRSRQVEKEVPLLEVRLKLAESDLARISQMKNEVDEAVSLAERARKSAAIVHDRTLRQQNLKKEFLTKSSEQLVNELNRSIEELTWLSGTYNLSLGAIEKVQESIRNTKGELESLGTWNPEFRDPNTNAPDIEAAQASLQTVQERQRLLSDLKGNLSLFVSKERAFQTDDTVLSEHLFRMQVLVAVLGEMNAELPPGEEAISIPLSIDNLIAHVQQLDSSRTEIAKALGEALSRLNTIDGDISSVTTSHESLNQRLEALVRERDLIAQAEQLDQELQELEVEALVLRFQTTSNAMTQKMKELDTAKKEFGELDKQERALEVQFSSLPDPLTDDVKASIESYFVDTRIRFYALSGIEAAVSSGSTSTDAGGSNASTFESTAQDSQAFRQTLSVQKKNLDERSNIRTDWLERLNDLSAKCEQMATIQSALRLLALERYTIAVELKKRLGRGELANSAIPEGLAEALDTDQIHALEAEATQTSEIQRAVTTKSSELNEPDESESRQTELLSAILETIGKRSDLERDQQKLAQTVSEGENALSEIQLKTREQEAFRLLESDTSVQERLLSFVPSARAEGLQELMRDHYREVLEIEDNQINLQAQSDILKQLVDSLSQEHATVTELRVLLESRETAFRVERLSAENEVQQQLRALPGNTTGSADTSEPAAMPTSLTAEEVDELVRSIQRIYEDEALSGKWLEFLDERMSPRGLASELSQYQQRLGDIEIQSASNKRRIDFLQGVDEPTLVLAKESSPEGVMRANSGEIGVLRAERLELLQGEVIWTLGRILGTIIGTAFLLFAVDRISKYRRKKAEERNASAHTFFVLSFFSTVLKLTIWIFAVLLLFSVLGFQVGTILAGLGIGGLAVAMAARETLANILGGIMIFFEKPFSIGDVIKIGPNTARVVGMTWRTTRLKTPFGYSICVPNSQATESMIKNFSHTDPPGDYFMVYISARHDPQKVIPIMNKAIADCESVLKDQAMGTWVAEAAQMGNMTVMAYWPWWSIKDYGARNGTRNEVWQSIWKHMNEAGIELEVHPFQFEDSQGFHPGLRHIPSGRHDG